MWKQFFKLSGSLDIVTVGERLAIREPPYDLNPITDI